MGWRWLGALLLLPVQLLWLAGKAAACLVLPPRLRDLSRESVLITGGGRGIGRHLATEFAKRGARKVRGVMPGSGGGHCTGAGVPCTEVTPSALPRAAAALPGRVLGALMEGGTWAMGGS